MLEPIFKITDALTGSNKGSAGLAENLGKAAAYMIPMLVIFKVGEGALALVKIFDDILGPVIKIVSKWEWLKDLVVLIGENFLPISLTIGAIAIWTHNIIELTKNWDDTCLATKQTVEDLKNVFKDCVKWIVSGIGQSENFESIWKFIKDLITAIITPFGLITKIIDFGVEKTGLFKKEWEFIKGLATGVGDAFKSVVGGVLSFLIQKAEQLANTLKGMMGMSSGGNNGGATAIGGSADEGNKYVGAVLSILEAPSRQGRVDVAQVIANRTQSNFGGNGGTIRDQAFAGGQFEPFFNGIGKNDIQNRETAIKALQAKGLSATQAAKELDEFFVDIANAGMVADSASKVAGRAYFKGTSQQGNMSGDDFLRNKNENFFHHEGNDPANRQVGSISGLFGSAGNGGGFGNGAAGVASFGASFPGNNGGYKIYDSTTDAVISDVSQTSRHHTSSGHESGRTYKDVGGKEEEVTVNNRGQSLVKKDMVLENGSQDRNAPILSGVSGFVGSAGDGGWGDVEIYADEGRKTIIARLGHMKNILVKTGDKVAIGQQVGTQGNVGTSAVHLHAEYLPEHWNQAIGVMNGNKISGGGASNMGSSGGSKSGSNGIQSSEVTEANNELAELRSTGKEEEAAKAEKEAEKLAKKQEELDRKHQKAIEAVNKMQDQGVTQQRKREKESRQIDKDERLQALDRQLATTTNSDVKSTLENTKKKINVGSSESEKIVEDENRVADLEKLKSRKLKDLKSPIAEVKEKAQQEPDYSQAIKDQQILLDSRRKLRNEMEVTASLEFNTANKTKNEDLEKVTRIQTTTEAYNKEKRMLEELKTRQETEDPTAVKNTEMMIKRLDVQHASSIALIEEESKLKKATEARDEYNKALLSSGGKPDDTLKRLSTEVDNIEKKVKDINADKNSKLKVIDLDEIKNAKELARVLKEVQAAKEGEVNASKTNLMKAKAGVLRQGGDEFGANALDRSAAKKDQTIENNARVAADDKRIEERSKQGLPYSIKEIKDFRSETDQINKIKFDEAGNQFKTLGETIGTTFKASVSSALKDVLTGAKTMGQAFNDVLSSMLSKLAELAVNSLLKDLMGGMFGGGGGGGGGFGGLISGIFGGPRRRPAPSRKPATSHAETESSPACRWG